MPTIAAGVLQLAVANCDVNTAVILRLVDGEFRLGAVARRPLGWRRGMSAELEKKG